MEQSIHAKDSDVGKLALKNSTLKAQVAMAESQLKQKEEQGDALHPIDFEQLKIEHEQYVRKIEEKNAELLRLKRATGNVVEQLSKTKRKLSDTIKRGTWLRDQMIFKRQLSATFDEALKRAAYGENHDAEAAEDATELAGAKRRAVGSRIGGGLEDEAIDFAALARADELERCTAAALKRYCKEHALPVTGVKAALAERVKAHASAS